MKYQLLVYTHSFSWMPSICIQAYHSRVLVLVDSECCAQDRLLQLWHIWISYEDNSINGHSFYSNPEFSLYIFHVSTDTTTSIIASFQTMRPCMFHLGSQSSSTSCYSGTSIMRTPLVPSEVSWVKRCPYFEGFRYISGRRGNAYSCRWALRRRRSRALPSCTMVRKDNQRLELCVPVLV